MHASPAAQAARIRYTTGMTQFLQAQKDRAAQRLDAAIAPNAFWGPAPEYTSLIAAERTATQVLQVGLPGLLLPEAYRRATNGALRRGDITVGERQIELVNARQAHFAARRALGEVGVRTCVPSDTFARERLELLRVTGDSRRADGLLAGLARTMLWAVEDGWDIRLIPTAVMQLRVGQHARSTIFCQGMEGEPTAGVYLLNSDAPDVPHETWRTDPETIAHYTQLQNSMEQWAASPDQTLKRLEAWAEDPRVA